MSAMPLTVRSLARLNSALKVAVLVLIGLWLADMIAGWFDRLLFSIGVLLAIVVAGLIGDPLWIRFRESWIGAETAAGAPRGDVEDRFYREYEE